MKDLLEAGVHFGHQTKRWNPKMKEYIFGERNGIYIIDLNKTVKKFRDAEDFVTNLAADGKTVLFVGTKRQAQDVISEEAQRCGMFYINQRWLGGLLTNFTTIQRSLARLRDIEAMPGRDPGGIIVTMLLGIAGAVIGGFVGRALGFYGPGQAAGWLMSFLGAVILLFIYRMFVGRRTVP